MKRVYAEVGVGNETFFSTEFEEGVNEYRVPRFVWPERINGYYVRLWVGKKVYILSTNHGFEITKKSKYRFKLLLGVSGVEVGQ